MAKSYACIDPQAPEWLPRFASLDEASACARAYRGAGIRDSEEEPNAHMVNGVVVFDPVPTAAEKAKAEKAEAKAEAKEAREHGRR